MISGIILFCHGVALNFSLNMENSPSTVLHASFLKFVNVCINCMPSVPHQFLFIGTLSSSVHWSVLVWNMLVTSIAKLINSTHLSETLQSQESCYRTGPPCICLHASPMLTVFTPHICPVFASLITTIAAVAPWLAICMTTDWIISDYKLISQWKNEVYKNILQLGGNTLLPHTFHK